MAKVVFVLLDGLAYGAAQEHMAFMAALTGRGIARQYGMQCGLPPLSRPMYATLLTGFEPLDHGIFRNEDSQKCPLPTIFSVACVNGLVTCAAAYHWFFELCAGKPYDPGIHRHWHDSESDIMHGIFYRSDDYPDEELFGDAESLRRRFEPDFLLAHSMGIDNAGHRAGADSASYRNAVRAVDNLLAQYVPVWLKDGYQVLVTSDHGMNADGCHYDVAVADRLVPLWLLGPDWPHTEPSQNGICDAVAHVLGLTWPLCHLPRAHLEIK